MNTERIILHLDMDSFYASVEVREHPGLKGKPVIVGADPKGGAGRGVVSTCSYEARAFGIHSAMPISRAYYLCPDAVFVRPSFPLYSAASRRIMEILKRRSEKFQQVSIDEAFLDISSAGDYGTATDLALEIKREIREKEGLTCSIGVAPAKIVAKIASDYRKPDGLTVVPPGEVEQFLFPLPVGKIPGIGKKTGTELASMGIVTIGDLAGTDIQVLIGRFGKWGLHMHSLAHGADDEEVLEREGYKSTSRESTFEQDTEDSDFLISVLDELADDISQSLKKDGVLWKTATIKVRYQGFLTHTRSRTIYRSTADPSTLRAIARILLAEMLDGRKVRLIGLRVSALEKADMAQRRIDDFF
jgi:DNA polymerase IV (DinB-like DNA polymerase)